MMNLFRKLILVISLVSLVACGSKNNTGGAASPTTPSEDPTSPSTPLKLLPGGGHLNAEGKLVMGSFVSAEPVLASSVMAVSHGDGHNEHQDVYFLQHTAEDGVYDIHVYNGAGQTDNVIVAEVASTCFKRFGAHLMYLKANTRFGGKRGRNLNLRGNEFRLEFLQIAYITPVFHVPVARAAVLLATFPNAESCSIVNDGLELTDPAAGIIPYSDSRLSSGIF